MGEFDIIKAYFAPQSSSAILSVGDDCGLFQLSPGCVCNVTTDTLVSTVHFFADVDPFDLGWKSLAVNVSDLAAMGANPRYFTLALTLPGDVSNQYIASFSKGLLQLAKQHHIELIGGDTTHGPLSITITAIGETPKGKEIRRSGAKDGDHIWVTGDLGSAAFAVDQIKKGQIAPSYSYERLVRPQPRVAIGIQLRGIAGAMLDISDGLLADLSHILQMSNVGATINAELIPLGADLKKMNNEQALTYALTGGDDYELCFCANSQHDDFIKNIAHNCGVPITQIGTITSKMGIELKHFSKDMQLPQTLGYQHF